MLLGIIIFVLLVVVHELGHFIAAKRNGVEVEEFGIGFPPRLFGKKMGKGKWRTHYTFNLIPLGGFVRLKGENEKDKRKGSYGAARFRIKAKIILAGVAVNALVAILIFSWQAATGMPKLIDNQFELESFVTDRNQRLAVAVVDDDTPASQIGLSQGDIIVSINDKLVETEADLLAVLEVNRSKLTEITYQTNGQQNTVEVELLDGSGEEGVLGIIPLELVETRHNPLVAPIVGIGTAVHFSAVTIDGFATSLWRLITGNFSEAAENVTGPVGIFSILTSLENVGIDYLIFFAAIISLTLAIMNVLPLPALDGGRLAMSYLINSHRFKISTKREELIHVIGFVSLLLLALLITLVDIGRF